MRRRSLTCLAVCFLVITASSSVAQTPTTFTRADISVGNHPVSIAVADGDGKPDLAVLTQTPSTAVISIYLGNGDGTFSSKTSFLSGQSVWMTAADLNRDGFADLVVANSYSRSVSVFLANGDGTTHPEISSNATNDEILWFINGAALVARDAATLEPRTQADRLRTPETRFPHTLILSVQWLLMANALWATNSLVIYGLLPQ